MYVEIRDIQPQVEMRKTVFFGCVFSAYFHIPFQQIHTQSVEYGRSISHTYFSTDFTDFQLIEKYGIYVGIDLQLQIRRNNRGLIFDISFRLGIRRVFYRRIGGYKLIQIQAVGRQGEITI